jgi:serine/threonine-protein kinase
MPATAPDHLGPYILERTLGRGAHGTVYRAHHRDAPDHPVALKVVTGRGAIERLLVEPAVLSRLDHPCIVHLEDYFVNGNDLVLALEFIEGQDLKTLLDRGEKFSPEDVRSLLVQLGGALAAAHAQRVIHRDIKPANILAVRHEDGWRFVLTDFGIGQEVAGIQLHKHGGGTYAYMAPEQLRGRPVPQSDLWSLGVVAYRMLTGRLPFEAESLADLSHQILYSAVPPLSKGDDAPIAAEIESAILRLLDKSLQERTAAAEDLLRQLEHRGSSADVGKVQRQPKREAVSQSLDRQLRRQLFWTTFWFVVCAVAYILSGGYVTGVVSVAGLVLFGLSQSNPRLRPRQRVGAITLAYLLWIGVTIWRETLRPTWDIPLSWLPTLVLPALTTVLSWFGFAPQLVAGVLLGGLYVFFFLFFLWIVAIGGALYARRRWLQREQLLRDTAAEAGFGSDRYLQALRGMVDRRFEDVGLHLKYAEALFARGKVLEAAVEAKLLLVQDPYNFNGNLLLANACDSLGLAEECLAVCHNYLAFSGYCFEFHELRERCLRRLGRS